MKYSIKVNEVKSEDSQIKAFATVTFGDSLLVRNIAIVSRKDTDELFVSMPSYRTNDVTERGEPIYRDICNPITKEFYDELTTNILSAYNNRKELAGKEATFGDDPEGRGLLFTVKVTPLSREDSSLRGLGRIYLDDNFVISNVKMVEGKHGMFISMPDYRTEKYKDGKPIYRELVFPITKDFRERLFGEFERQYAASKEKKTETKPDKDVTKAPKKTSSKRPKAEEESEPKLAAAR